MSFDVTLQLVAVLLLGVGAQWFAWRLHQPSIAFLLLAGFVLGPLTGAIRTDDIFGKALFPFISLAVAIILFEGGMSLRIQEVRKALWGSILRLLSIGVLITWAGSFLAARYIVGLELDLAILLGAILTVTGPTVIIPLLRSFDMEERIRSILKWEGIIVDPIGAVLSVIVFEVILAGAISQQGVLSITILGVAKTLIAGIGLGLAGAFFLVFFMMRGWIPDFLHNPVTLGSVLFAFTVSNEIQHESGLLAVTVMGFTLANQKYYNMRHILEFKENLQVLLIAVLFIVLSARIEISTIQQLDYRAGIFLAVLIFVVRPVAVVLSTLGTNLNWRHIIFLSWMAPRGIVAAAVSSVFALELVQAGHEGARIIVPLVFLVIIGTVTVYGFTARPVARLVGLARPDPQGILLVGAHSWARSIARILHEHKFRIIVVDTNDYNIRSARMMSLEGVNGNILDERIQNNLEFSGVGKLVAMTPNDEVNSLAVMKFMNMFGRYNVYQLSPSQIKTRESVSGSGGDVVPRDLRGRCLFRRDLTYESIGQWIQNGAEFRATHLTKTFSFEDYKKHYGANAIPMFIVNEQHELLVISEDLKVVPHAGQILIGLVNDGSEKEAKSG